MKRKRTSRSFTNKSKNFNLMFRNIVANKIKP